jgi:hypothetical protein
MAAGLFGSFARGDAGTESDIDLLVVVETAKQRERVSALLSDKLPEFAERYGLPLQPVIFERRRITNARGGMQDLIENAEQDWTPVAGEDFKQIRKMLASPKTTRRRSA